MSLPGLGCSEESYEYISSEPLEESGPLEDYDDDDDDDDDDGDIGGGGGDDEEEVSLQQGSLQF
ncbi:hypothetical protein Z043_102162 [Scleropages formosus]|uniref:Uncharacterized protein n=1 Tax=Scleropages formosus TaxID=113540 RepID=A0A0P7XNB8_SCLFO|nr:hypothetical protein Z043_102162 [Scleropages formosus]